MVAPNVCIKLVSGFVVCLHLIANPLGMVVLPLLGPEALVFLNVGMRFAMLECFAMRARVVSVTGTTACAMGVAACAWIAAFPAMSASAVGFVGGGVTVRLDGQGLFAGVGFRFNGLMLKELGE